VEVTTVADKLLTTDDICEIFSVTPQTAWRWRKDGIGPKWIKVGQTVRYFPITADAA
jgi:hypothetical protein